LSFATTLATVTLVTAIEDYNGIQETAASFSLFPNPANESVTIKGDHLGLVSVFNILGQKVEEFEVADNELRIITTDYENGVYVVKTDNRVMKFVVKH
jgi:hypothetical protein